MNEIDPEIRERLSQLDAAFSPSAPISSRDFFRGRFPQISAVVESINERGQHVVVFGDRGVGKTSFSNVIGTELENVIISKVTCSRTDTFDQLWSRAIRKVKFQKTSTGVGFNPTEHKQGVTIELPGGDEISSSDIQTVLSKVSTNLLFIFDEYDSVTDTVVHTKMADTIKALSDSVPWVTCMLVGIGSNITELIGEHPSIERCMRQVSLPHMSDSELHQIIDCGIEHLGIEIDEAVCQSIVASSMGYPHFTHLLAKNASRACLVEGGARVEISHLNTALHSSLERMDESIRNTYQQATMTSKKSSRFEPVLWACGQARLDEHATFRAADIIAPFQEITGEKVVANSVSYHLGALASNGRGNVLEKVEQSRNSVRYRFRQPLMRAYVRLRRQVDRMASEGEAEG